MNDPTGDELEILAKQLNETVTSASWCFSSSVGLEPIRVLQSPFATHITYRVKR